MPKVSITIDLGPDGMISPELRRIEDLIQALLNREAIDAALDYDNKSFEISVLLLNLDVSKCDKLVFDAQLTCISGLLIDNPQNCTITFVDSEYDEGEIKFSDG